MARTVYETAAAARRRRGHPRARPQRADLHVPAPVDYATSVLAGAIAAGWRGPVFIQGDHYQFNAKKYAADPEAMTEEIRRACRLAIEAGYRNIDIDSLDARRPLEADRRRAAARELPPRRGADRPDPDARDRRRDGQRRRRDRRGRQAELERGGAARVPRRLPRASSSRARRAPRASRKVSVQTGTSPRRRAAAGRRRGRGQARLRGAARARRRRPRRTGWPAPSSTARRRCRTSCSIDFPAVETAEIHLATGFQNALYEHPAFPAELHREIEAWCCANTADERKPDQTDEQFLYTTRKKAIGPFKRQLWDLPTKDEILAAQRRKIALPLHGARGERLARMVDRYIEPVESHDRCPMP